MINSNTFHIYPNQLRPLLSELVKFIAEFQGLSQIKILSLHSYPEKTLFKGSEIAERFNRHFCSKKDYSVISYKA